MRDETEDLQFESKEENKARRLKVYRQLQKSHGRGVAEAVSTSMLRHWQRRQRDIRQQRIARHNP